MPVVARRPVSLRKTAQETLQDNVIWSGLCESWWRQDGGKKLTHIKQVCRVNALGPMEPRLSVGDREIWV